MLLTKLDQAYEVLNKALAEAEQLVDQYQSELYEPHTDLLEDGKYVTKPWLDAVGLDNYQALNRFWLQFDTISDLRN